MVFTSGAGYAAAMPLLATFDPIGMAAACVGTGLWYVWDGIKYFIRIKTCVICLYQFVYLLTGVCLYSRCEIYMYV